MARDRRDGVASFVGLIVFLAGIGLIALTFRQAWELFSQAPRLNMGMKDGQAIDFTVVGVNLSRLVVQVLLLIVMTGIGSALANRGVKMYASAGSHHPVKERPEATERSDAPLI
jgi:hypothetical protein